MDPRTAVPRFAQLNAMSMRLRAMGQPVPPQVAAEMQQLQTAAQASLTPQEFAQVARGVEVLTAQALQNYDRQSQQAELQRRTHTVDKLTREMMHGKSSDQMAAILAGDDKYAVKGKGIRAGKAKRNILETINRDARRMGYDGQDLTYKRWTQIVERYNDVKGAKSPEAATQYLAKMFKNPQAAAGMVEGFNNSGADIRIGLAERRGEDTDAYQEVTESDQLRAEIVKQFGREAARDRGTMETLTEGISDDYLESDAIHGDVARAFVQEQAKSEEEDVRSFDFDDYNEEELSNGTY